MKQFWSTYLPLALVLLLPALPAFSHLNENCNFPLLPGSDDSATLQAWSKLPEEEREEIVDSYGEETQEALKIRNVEFEGDSFESIAKKSPRHAVAIKLLEKYFDDKVDLTLPSYDTQIYRTDGPMEHTITLYETQAGTILGANVYIAQFMFDKEDGERSTVNYRVFGNYDLSTGKVVELSGFHEMEYDK